MNTHRPYFENNVGNWVSTTRMMRIFSVISCTSRLISSNNLRFHIWTGEKHFNHNPAIFVGAPEIRVSDVCSAATSFVKMCFCSQTVCYSSASFYLWHPFALPTNFQIFNWKDHLLTLAMVQLSSFYFSTVSWRWILILSWSQLLKSMLMLFVNRLYKHLLWETYAENTQIQWDLIALRKRLISLCKACQFVVRYNSYAQIHPIQKNFVLDNLVSAWTAKIWWSPREAVLYRLEVSCMISCTRKLTVVSQVVAADPNNNLKVSKCTAHVRNNLNHNRFIFNPPHNWCSAMCQPTTFLVRCYTCFLNQGYASAQLKRLRSISGEQTSVSTELTGKWPRHTQSCFLSYWLCGASNTGSWCQTTDAEKTLLCLKWYVP